MVSFFWSVSIAFQRFDSWFHQFERRFGLIPKRIFVYCNVCMFPVKA
jgi:hypothetical protein